MKRTILFVLILAAVVWLGAQWADRFRGSDASLSPTPVRHNDLIELYEPLPGDTVRSPITVRGRARGQWYFEGDFPVVLTDWDGRIIATVPAQAQGEWMTTDWVPFEATVEFDADTSVSDRGSLILQKDNPSGLPEHDDALEITVFFE
jgi:hypothetical protein